MTIKPEITFIENILKQNELLLNNEYDLLGITFSNNLEFFAKKSPLSRALHFIILNLS